MERRCADKYWINLCKEIQAAANLGDTKTMHSLMKTALGPVVEDGQPIEDHTEQLERWVEHYSKLSGQDLPEHSCMEVVLSSFGV